jgi:hypothetical protein
MWRSPDLLFVALAVPAVYIETAFAERAREEYLIPTLRCLSPARSSLPRSQPGRPVTESSRDRQRRARGPEPAKMHHVRGMASTRIAERARRVSPIGRRRAGDQTDPRNNQTDPHPVSATQRLAEKPPARDGNDDEGERDEGICRTERDARQHQTHSTVAAA